MAGDGGDELAYTETTVDKELGGGSQVLMITGNLYDLESRIKGLQRSNQQE